MLREIQGVKQVPGEPTKRWFTSPEMDLFVWTDDNHEIVGYQLSYDKSRSEKAAVWQLEGSVSHFAVDDGARPGKHPGSPLLVDGDTAFPGLAGQFSASRGQVPEEIFRFILSTLGE